MDFLQTLQVAAGYVLHVGEVGRGAMRVGDKVTAAVNLKRRADIVPNHTFTHVLNFALREVRHALLLLWTEEHVTSYICICRFNGSACKEC